MADAQTQPAAPVSPSPARKQDGVVSWIARPLLAPVELIGKMVLRGLEATGGVGLLLWHAARLSGRAYFRGRGRRLQWQNLFFQMVRVGVRAIPIVCLVVFCIGAILALQIVPILRTYGAEDQVATVISVAMFRELGPLIGAITLTGFAGASIAAEIGTMTVSEEIEAMETHAIHPVQFLVVPRVIATAVMTTCLAVLADLMGVLGGGSVSVLLLEMSATRYRDLTFEAIEMGDFLTGLVKAAVFGTIISGLACWLGLGVRGGAEGVGNATTRTVVLTVVALTIVDLLFTAVFFYLKV